jgi:hypothetical protein
MRCGCNPADIGILGVGVETTFLRGALDRLGIEPEYEQRHEYKNAVNIFELTEFTPAHRESLARLAESVFTEAVEDIAAGRRDGIRGGPQAGRHRSADRSRGSGSSPD